MDYGLCLPNFPAAASPEGIDAATEVAERLGMSTVWTTDHVLVPEDAAADYGRIGVEHIALYFDTTDPAEIVARVQRFERDVVPLV